MRSGSAGSSCCARTGSTSEMCGLCGIVALGRPPEAGLARAMADELRHRGPDGEGVWTSDAGAALGHRRLQTIALSMAVLQPFPSEDGRLQLLHNGEIYNYR